MVHMRLLNEVVPELKKIDPNTPVTRNAVRQWGLSGKIPTVMAGRKRLYNMEALLDFLSHDKIQDNPQSTGIRAVSEKAGLKHLENRGTVGQ